MLTPGLEVRGHTIERVLRQGPLVHTARARASDGSTVVFKAFAPEVFDEDSAAELVALVARLSQKRPAGVALPRGMGVWKVGDQERLCLVREHIDGPPLAQWRRGTPPWPPGEAVRLVVSILKTLAGVHREGITARSLSPANLIGEHGAEALVDVGLPLVDPGNVGSVMFRSPEELSGARPDPRSDLHAIGVLLHLLVVGRPPFEPGPLEVLKARKRAGVSGLPEGPLGTVIGRLLVPDPARRYQNASQLLAALEPLVGAEAPRAPARPPPPPAPEPPRPAMEEARPATGDASPTRGPEAGPGRSGVDLQRIQALMHKRKPAEGPADAPTPPSRPGTDAPEPLPPRQDHLADEDDEDTDAQGDQPPLPTPGRPETSPEAGRKGGSRPPATAGAGRSGWLGGALIGSAIVGVCLLGIVGRPEGGPGPSVVATAIDLASATPTPKAGPSLLAEPVDVAAGEALLSVPTGEERRIALADFTIDRTEVTNEDFATFVQEARHPTTGLWLKHAGRRRNRHPVRSVTWEEAAAFARWAGKRLPTSDEWEYAARGREGRRYPWGATFEPGRCQGGSQAGDTAEIGSFPAGVSPCGALDMAGNVWEWTADREGRSAILRGGSFRSSAEQLEIPRARLRYPIDRADDDFGFRCVQDR